VPVRILSAADQRALDAALQHVALFGRDDLLPVLVTGQDRAKFLHNMLTQEVKALEPGRVLPAVLCDAQGGMIAVVSMVVQSERIVLWTDRARAQDLAEALDKYVIMDEVELAVDEDLALVGLVGPDA
jgi:folate-binding Fe-S cluster repair protein YgfZ